MKKICHLLWEMSKSLKHALIFYVIYANISEKLIIVFNQNIIVNDIHIYWADVRTTYYTVYLRLSADKQYTEIKNY